MKLFAYICSVVFSVLAGVCGVYAQDHLLFDKHTVSVKVDRSGKVALHTSGTAKKVKLLTSKVIRSNQVLATQAISVNVQTVNATCRSMDGSINAVASGGTPPYTYRVNGDGPFNNGYYPRMSPGNHTVEVTDATRNVSTVIAVVGNTNEPPVLTVTSFTHPSSCDIADGSFVIAASGGQPPYEYTLDMVNFRTTPSFNNLPAGYHVVVVRDAKGCMSSARITLITPPWCGIPFGLTYSSAFCENEGVLTVTYYGDDPPYENRLNGAPFGNTTDYSSLAPGEYTIDIRSGSGKTTKFMFHMVKGCYPRTDVEVVHNSCNASDGRAILTTDNGTPPYRYSIDGVNFQTSNEFSGLSAGAYNIGVIDDQGVIMRIVADVNGGCFDVTAHHTDVVCSNHNGRIEVEALGGNAPYTYSINGSNFQISPVFEGLEAGEYRITVSDADEKMKSITVEIENTAGPQIIIPSSPPGCWGDLATLTVRADGGMLPFQYSINDIDYQSSPEFEIFIGQSYNVSVKDANGCKIGVLYYPPISCFQVTVDVFNAACGNNNGRLQVNAANGKSPFAFSIDGVQFQSSNTFSNLLPGVYQVTVRDADNVTRKISAEVKSTCPQIQLQLQHATCGDANGKIIATGSNGQEPYQYSLNGAAYSNQSSFQQLRDGTYNIFLKDASGFIVQQQVMITTTPKPQINVHAIDAQCTVGGTVTITAAGGSGPLLYSIDGTHYSTDPIFRQLQPAVYEAYTVDNLGCKASMPIEVELVNDLAFDITDDMTVCEGTAVSLAVNDPKPGYRYAWSGSDGLNGPSGSSLNITPGRTTMYNVAVTEGFCVAARSVIVSVLPAPVSNAGQDITICAGQSVRLNGAGGQTYSWSPSLYLSDPHSSQPEVVRPASSQAYHLTVKDANGCESLQPSSVSVNVTPPAALFVGNDTIVVKNIPFQLSATDVNNSGFTSYEWTPAYGLNDPHIRNPVATLSSGAMYSVTATTASGCESRSEIKIDIYDGPDIYVPNAFTPNDDGVNDDFKVLAVGIKMFKHFAVYNRWGQQVFYSTDPLKGWNGRVASKPADTGTYVWKVEGIDDEGRIISRRGTVILIR